MTAVRFCAAQMDSQYGDTVFDEWIVVSLQQPQPRILHYVTHQLVCLALDLARALHFFGNRQTNLRRRFFACQLQHFGMQVAFYLVFGRRIGCIESLAGVYVDIVNAGIDDLFDFSFGFELELADQEWM